MAQLDRIRIKISPIRRQVFSFPVMARLVRATHRGTVLVWVARTSRAMTLKDGAALDSARILMPMRTSRAMPIRGIAMLRRVLILMRMRLDRVICIDKVLRVMARRSPGRAGP
jgi:hypothetical protein